MSSFFVLHPMQPLRMSTGFNSPEQRGRADLGAPIILERLASDAIGNFTLTLTNVVPGSSYDVEVLSTGETVTAGIAGAASVVLTIPVYPAGSPKNALRVKLRKGSAAPFYQPFETQATAVIGAQSIFINQLDE